MHTHINTHFNLIFLFSLLTHLVKIPKRGDAIASDEVELLSGI